MEKIKIYDTTLRDGAQTEGISFSNEDKIKIIKKLDEVGIDYIECGWPSSNTKDLELFSLVKDLKLKHSKLVAFGSTRHKNKEASDDKNLISLIDSDMDAITIFGKSWDFQVTRALETTLDENLNMIYDSIKFLKTANKEIIYDAEHFFDGYKSNKEYALKTLKLAQDAGADCIVLCDTNGGLMPFELEDILLDVRKHIKISLGIHSHNDSGMADAISVMSVKLGLNVIQGTINGYGERCGNSDLITCVANVMLKLGKSTSIELNKLKNLSYYVSEVANIIPSNNHPYVGSSAFAHKAGVHASAIIKNSKTYEHIDPELVGNTRKILISELSGKSNILSKIKNLNLKLNENDDKISSILNLIKSKEKEGFHYEGAEASLEVLIFKEFENFQKFFNLKEYSVEIKKSDKNQIISVAKVILNIKGKDFLGIGEGEGPIEALDIALRKATETEFKILKEVSLIDFKVRVISSEDGTNSKVRVLIESKDKNSTFMTMGVSRNIIEASYEALVDSIEYKLLKEMNNK